MRELWGRPYQFYLFDLDGTLVDTAPDISASLNFALEQDGLDCVSEALTRHWVGHGSKALISEALSHLKVTRDPEPLLKNFIDYYQNNIAVNSAPYPGVTDTLKTLVDRGAKLGVVTNKLTTLTMLLLENLQLDHYFQTVVCGDSTKNPKPSPEPVFLAMEKLDASTPETLFVGDSITDVEAARNAGLVVVCMRDGYNHGVDVSTLNCHGVIDSFDQLL